MYELGRHLKHFSRCVSASNRQCLLEYPTTDVSFIPKRTTFILKRKYPVKLPRMGENVWRLKGKDYVYDFVKNTEYVKKPDVPVVLRRYVDGLGSEGDLISVPRTKAYTEYIVTGLADFATPEVVEAANIRKSQQEYTAERASSRFAPLTVKYLEKQVLNVVMNKETVWTIKPWHVRVAFRKAGILVPEAAIKLPDKSISGPDLGLEQKDFIAVVTINGKEKANVRCRIHHWATNPSNRLPHVKFSACLKTAPVFEEEADILDQLPLQPEPKKSLY